MQLLWPTVEEIRTCDVGYAAGGSIPGNGKNVRRPHLTEKFHKWAKPNDDDDDDAHPMGRRKHMPHIKTFSRYVPAVSAAAVDADPSIGEMKRALQSAMVNIASCVEKSDLRAKYDALTPYQKKTRRRRRRRGREIRVRHRVLAQPQRRGVGEARARRVADTRLFLRARGHVPSVVDRRSDREAVFRAVRDGGGSVSLPRRGPTARDDDGDGDGDGDE